MEGFDFCGQADTRGKHEGSMDGLGPPKNELEETSRPITDDRSRGSGMSPPLGADLVVPAEEFERHSEDSPGAAAESVNPQYMKESTDGLSNESPKNLETNRIQTLSPDGPVFRMPLQEGLDHGGLPPFNRSTKKSMLIKAVMEYVQSVEEKLDGLNTTLGQDRPAKLERDEGLPKAPGPAPGRHVPWIDVRLETKFYTCDGLFLADGNFRPACETELLSTRHAPYPGLRPPPPPGGLAQPPVHYSSLPHPNHSTYTCKSEPSYLIRVLYDPSLNNQGQVLKTGEIPKPDAVEIIGFMVTSRPIADFFDDRFGLEAGSDHVLKFGRPFRSVIRNINHLRDQLSSLDAKYGRHTAEVFTNTKPPISGSLEQDSSSQQFNDTSSSQHSAQTQFKDSYDGPEAFEHFKHFLDFVDEYLSQKIELFKALKAGAKERIAYEDLWMLFDTGDTIYCPSRKNRTVFKKEVETESDAGSVTDDDGDFHCARRRYLPQAYRVLATMGGSLLKRTWAPKETKLKSELWSPESLLQLFQGRSARDTVYQSQQADFLPKQLMKERFSPLHVICMYIDFDGVRYGTQTDMFVFKPFDGEVSIKSLEAFPLQFAVSPRANYLSDRGRKFVDITSSSKHMKHSGFTVGENKEEVNSAVVIDLKLSFTEYEKEFPVEDMVTPTFKTFSDKFWPEMSEGLSDLYGWPWSSLSLGSPPLNCWHGPYCHGPNCVRDLYEISQKGQLKTLEPRIQDLIEEADYSPQEQSDIDRFKAYLGDQDLIALLPGVVPGFALHNRAWVQLSLDQLDFVEKEDEWKKLTLPKGHKQIVQAMVETHSSGSETSVDNGIDKIEMDLVRGKGRGCIILLHGVPGVGKTSTAECVASYTKRPLYSITCGDVGYEPEDVERNMGRHFKLAHRWGCVLLLDEADVFLAKRNKTDVKRNGLVSSFLRILEYYSGILFLTTNRVGAIDDAFRSRLHLTLFYPKLTRTQTLRIWKTNLQRLKEINVERVGNGRQPIEFNARKIRDWVSDHWEQMQWNGRQIRNGFQTAVALAEFKAKQSSAQHPGLEPVRPVLEIKQFKLLVKASKQFNDYLHRTHGDDEEQRAVLDQVRATSDPSRGRASNFYDDDDYDDDEDDGSTQESDSASDAGISEDSERMSGIDSTDDDSASKSHKSKKHEKKSGKSKARIVKEERREKSKGRKR